MMRKQEKMILKGKISSNAHGIRLIHDIESYLQSMTLLKEAGI